MKHQFTINEIKKYILSKDSLEDVLLHLSEESIREANSRCKMSISELRDAIDEAFVFDSIRVVGQAIVIEDKSNPEDEPHDWAIDMVMAEFPQLEVVKKSDKKLITVLKIKSDE